MARLLAVTTACYGATVGALLLTGRHPSVPWSFGPFLLIVALPAALVLAGLHAFDGRRLGAMAGTGVGIGLLAWSDRIEPWLIGAIVVGVTTARVWRRDRAIDLGLGLLVLVTGYAAIWNANALAALVSVGRLIDPIAIAMDRLVLRLPGYTAVFPLVRMAWIVRVLDHAYFLLFAEVLAVYVWLVMTRPGGAAARWLAALLGAYAIGIAIFLLAPAVGPHIYAPDSFGPAWRDTRSYVAMRQMALDYGQTLRGGQVSGYSYFIALPSLHVAAAVICQFAARRSRPLFAALLPINVCLVASTVVLGFHYVVDVPAGLLLGALAGRAAVRPRATPIQ